MDALLLDFNGVIVDDERLHWRSFRDVLAEDGIALTEADYDADYLGLDDRAAFTQAHRRAGRATAPDETARSIARKARAYAVLAEKELVVVPGATAFVRAAAARGVRLAVVSGAIRPEIDAGLARAGLTDVIETVVSAEDVRTTKPDPAGLRLALRRLAERHGTGAWRAAVIEDSLPGLAAARALGAGCAMLTTSHPAGRLKDADVVWPSFAGREPEELAPWYRPVEVT